MDNQNEAKQARGDICSAGAVPIGQAVGRAYSPREQAERLLKADAEHRSLAADQALMLRMVIPNLRPSVVQLQQGITSWMAHQGFWQESNKGEKYALMHSELTEGLEAARAGLPPDHDEGEENELADTVIRILDYCGYYGLDLVAGIERKMLKNYGRPFKHGKAF